MSKLKVSGNASGTGVITLEAPNTNTDRTITLPDGDISFGVGIDDNATSTAITIDASENVGIGITSPNERLSVVAEDDASPADNGFSIYRSVGDDKVTINCQGGAAKFIADGGSAHMASIFYSYNGSTLSEHLRVEATGDVKVPIGNLVIGTAGKGIMFSPFDETVTNPGSDSNLLDDYEEGSYTVGFYDAASGGNTSSTTPTGYYTKIGNQVNVTFSASNINTGGLTSGNSAYISLPFTASSFTWGTGTLITDNVNFRSRDTLNAYVGNSATRCYIKASGQATSDAGIRWSEFVSGSSDIVSFSVTYTAA